MKKTISIMLIAILSLLWIAAAILILVVQEADGNYMLFFINKTLGLAAGFAAAMLYKHWSKTDSLVSAIGKDYEEEDAADVIRE